jgi:alpha-L-rhamnosidase
VKSIKSLLVLAICCVLFCSCSSPQKLIVKKLFCEFADNPIGLETATPRFGWVLKSSLRGQKQTAYQLLVASDEKNLQKENSDVWDSGRIESAQSVHVLYQGKPLNNHSTYFWQVRVWDKENVATEYSKPGRIEIAFLGNASWDAKWIGKGAGQQPDNEKGYLSSATEQSFPTDTVRHDGHSTLLRKAFKISKEIKSAKVYVCGLGLYELSLNGNKVGNAVLAPAKTLYSEQVLYDTFDVTEYLKTGGNAFGIMLGNGWFNPYKKWWSWRMQWFGSKRAIMQMNLEYTDGSSETISTDKSWKASTGPVTYSCIYDGEEYDANLEQTGWDLPNFDDSKWENVHVVKAPRGKLASHVMQPIRVTQTIKPIKIYNPDDGVYVYDMGQNFAGWSRIKVNGPKGTKITFRYAENIDDDGSLNYRSMNLAGATGSYILNGDGNEEYEPRFVFYGFRYVELTGFPGTPTLENLTGCVVHSDCEPTGTFECGNSLINKIHQTTLWSQRSNMVGYPMDCPQRDERLGWMGDAHVSAEQAMFNFYTPLFFQNWLKGVQSGQDSNGDLPYISPRPFMEAGTIAWSVAYPLIIWYHYLYYGDEKIIEDHYETIKRYLEFLDSTAQNYILPPDKYGDWLSIAPGWDRGGPAATSTGYYFYISNLLSKMAKILGYETESELYSVHAKKITDAYNKRYFDSAKKQYEDGSQFSNTFPLFLGIVPENQTPAVLENLLNNIQQNHGHLTTGILGSKYIMELLAAENKNEFAYLLTSQKDFPGWGNLVQGRTTFSEHWNQTGSNNHVMFGSVDNWYYRTLAGINIDDQNPGFKNIIIKPWVHPDVGWAKASLQTMRSKIASSWEYADGFYILDVNIPVNSTATVYVLASGPEGVTENGKTIDGDNDVKFLRQEEKYAVYLISSGQYSFKSTGIEGLIAKPYVTKPEILPQKTFITLPETVNVEFKSEKKNAEIHYTLDNSVPNKNSPVYKKPFTISKTTMVKAKAFKNNYIPSFTRTVEYVFVDPEKNGVKYELVNGEFSSVSEFAKSTKKRTGTTFNFGPTGLELPEFDYGLTFTGYIEIKRAGEYLFYCLSNDGSQVFVNNSLVVDNDGGHLSIEESGEITLSPGNHLIVVKYFQTGGGKELKVSYEGPGFEKMEIPAYVLFKKDQ